MKYWFKDWCIFYRSFPKSYAVIDVETTGLNIETDLIMDIAIREVKDTQPSSTESIQLNWTMDKSIDQDWLKKRLIETRTSVDTKYGVGTYKQKYSLMQKASYSPTDGLKWLHEKLLALRNNNMVIVGHNVISYDAEFIKSHLKRFLDIDYDFEHNEVWDTGVLEKASQLIDKYPWPKESFADYGNRVLKERVRGIKWNLHEHCCKKYNISNPDKNKEHTAAYDVLLEQQLFEAMRKLCE